MAFSRARPGMLALALGYKASPIPPEFGGSGADIMTMVLVMEALGYSCRDNGLIFSLNAQMWSIEIPILKIGSPEQKKKYLPHLVSGEIIGAHGMTETGSGSDAFSMRTTAENKGDRYVLNGSKLYITNAPVADFALVFATVDPTRSDFGGATAFLVDKETPGFMTSPSAEKMGLKTSPIGELILKNCEVPLENRLGRREPGLRSSTLRWNGRGAAYSLAP